MLTLVLYGLLAIAIMAGLFFLAASFLPAGEQIAPPVRDEAPWDLPMSRRLDAADVAAVRLPVALRGYRFAETDVLLDRLGEELRQRDAELARLRRAPHPYPSPIGGTDPADYRPPPDPADDAPPPDPADGQVSEPAEQPATTEPEAAAEPDRPDGR